MILTDIFPKLYVENKEFDCKIKLNRKETISWLKTVNGFANGEGGTIFLGVEDKTMTLIGFEQENIDQEKLFFHNEVKNHMSIIPMYSIDTVPYEINNTIRFIIKINIQKSINKPLILKYNGFPMVFVRRDGFTNPATEEELRLMVLNSNYVAFDKSLTNLDFYFSDYKKLASFYKERTNNDLRIKELEAIGFFIDGKITNGAYLFNDFYDGMRTKIVCSLYRGNTRGDDVVISSNSFCGNLIDCYYFMKDFIESRMNRGFIKLADRRIDVDAYPNRSIFEALINAIVHRDYLIDGTEIHVDMFKNRLVISSPGSLYVNLDDVKPTYNLDSFSSKRRNQLLADVFVLCKAMEAKGTGFEKIMEDYSAYDKAHQPFIFVKNNTFHIVLPDLTNEQGLSIDDDSIYIVGEILNSTKYDRSILTYCYLMEKSIKEITDYLNISNSTFFRKNIIDNLVSQGFLIEKDGKQMKTYLTNKEKVMIR